jgi:hypothetical protein
MTCAKKHHYKYVIGIERDKDSTPLRFGGNFHNGLEVLGNGHALSSAVEKATEGYSTYPAWAQDEESQNDWDVECVTVATLLRGYHAYWSKSDYHFAQLDHVAAEMAFELPIINPQTAEVHPHYHFAGKIDGIVKIAKERGRLAVFETKTTSESIDDEAEYWRRLRVDSQISGYIVAARAMDFDVETVIYNVIRKPTIRPKLVKGVRETPAQYGARLAADIAERPEYYFQRREIPRLKADLDEFLQELWDETQVLEFHERTGIAPRNTAACIQPYPCEMRDLCFNGVNPRDGVPQGYRIKTHMHPELAMTGE